MYLESLPVSSVLALIASSISLSGFARILVRGFVQGLWAERAFNGAALAAVSPTLTPEADGIRPAMQALSPYSLYSRLSHTRTMRLGLVDEVSLRRDLEAETRSPIKINTKLTKPSTPHNWLVFSLLF